VNREELNDLSGVILDACVTVHKEMGPGLMESVYELCLWKELELRKVKAETQVPISLTYRGFELSKDFRIDVLVEDEIVLELKTVEKLLPIHRAQLISYLKLAGKRLGFLINFNSPVLKNGFHRFVNGF